MKANTRMDCCICFISCWQWSMFLPIRWKIYIGNQHGALPKSYQERVLEGRKKFKCKLCNWKDDQQISLKFDNEQVTIINTPRYWPLNCQISRYLGVALLTRWGHISQPNVVNLRNCIDDQKIFLKCHDEQVLIINAN